MNNDIYILDSYGLIYRAYFALIRHPLTNPEGNNINSVVIFFKNLKALLSKYKPGFIAAAFDSRTKTFRHEMYTEYKATRQKTPDDLHAQVPWIEEILNALNIPVLRKDGYEADDIIATVAKKCRQENRRCIILSGDKDLLQLVNDGCLQMQPDKNNGGWETTDSEGVVQKWGIPPEKILDYLSLTGDAADNVPGVKGVGDKTAVKLLTEYGSLDGIYEHADEIKGALGEKIRADKENAYFSKKLITLCDEVPVEIDFERFSTEDLNYEEAAKVLQKYGAVQIAQSYAREAGVTLSAPASAQGTAHADVAATASTAAGYAGAGAQGAAFSNLNAAHSNLSAARSTENAARSTQAVKSPLDSLEPKTPVQNKGSYRPLTKKQELEDFINAVLNGKKEAAFDTETDSLDALSSNLVGFSLCCKSGEAVYIPVILPGEMFAPETISKEDCISLLEKLFYNPDVTVIMHNAKFDLKVLYANSLKQKISCKIFDTMIASWLLDSDASGKSPYSLESLGEKLLGLKGIEFNDVVPKGKTFADVDLEKAYPYGAEDADFTWQLFNILKPLIHENNLDELFYNMEMKVLSILTQMEITGIHLDKNALADYKVYLNDEIKKIEADIYKEAGHEFNIGSPKQLQTVLFEERGLKACKKTKTGYSTDSEALEELSLQSEDSLPEMILLWRKMTKLQSTYVETLPEMADSSSRIHTSFLQSGTATGRLSSRDPNLQNIPVRDENGRRIRSAFTAEEGTVLISADYSQIELVILAHLSGDKNLCDAFINGVDVHRSTAALVYGITPDEVTADQRRFAKTVNFGVMYGMSAFRLANELKISRTQAKDFIDKYFATYAQVKSFINRTIENAQANGWVQTFMGRRRYVKDINNANKTIAQGAQRIAVNTPIQGSAADIVKKAMIDVNEALEKSNSRAHMLLQVHDELIFECPDDEKIINGTIALIKEKMENAVKLSVPLRVSIEHGKNWGLFH